MGEERKRSPSEGQNPQTNPSTAQPSDASWPLSGRGTSHLAVAIDVVPHKLLQFGETLAGERGLAAVGPVREVEALVPPYSQSLLSA